MKKNFSQDDIKSQFQKLVSETKATDIEKVIKNENALLEKVLSSSFLRKELAKIKLLLKMINDYWNGNYKEIPLGTILAVVVALIYILNPIDLIPDFLPVIGQMDDLAMLLFVWDKISEDVKTYALWKIKQGDEDIKELYIEAFEEVID